MSFHPLMDYGAGHHQSARALPDEGPAFVYTPANLANLAQGQQGYITRNAMRAVAAAIRCTTAEVEDIVYFYTMFYTRPVGKHVHGLQGKFAQPDDEVVDSARDCVAPLTDGADDRVMPAFSSGQWAGTVPATWQAITSDDLLFMSGGGILAHPDGAAAGVASIRQAWLATREGTSLADYARQAPELARALAFF